MLKLAIIIYVEGLFMELISKVPRGTKDILPSETYKWQLVENIIKETAHAYGFKEIRTPVFEHTNLFKRSVGEETDIVQKEMYTFEDKGGRSLTLRPEGTVCVARALLENGLHNTTLPVKLYYFSSCYRYEKPQSGRYREFNQFGVECFGANAPTADAEVICLASSIFESLGISHIELKLNSIGCPECREKYYKALIEFLKSKYDDLCSTCKERVSKNPMRVLDCKNKTCQDVMKGSPVILDFLCDDCEWHFYSVKSLLDSCDVPYQIDSTIVRGLDYYTKTVFEFIYNNEKTHENLTVCGGGRYDELTKELGGPKLASLGFGLGMERLLDIMGNLENFNNIDYQNCDLFIASLSDKSKSKVFSLSEDLRREGLQVLCDLNNKSLKSQLKYANKIKAKSYIVIGDDELKKNQVELNFMDSDKTVKLKLDSNFIYNYIQAMEDFTC